MSREYILHRVRTALGRSVGDPPEEEAPKARIVIPPAGMDTRIHQFKQALENLNGVFYDASSLEDAGAYVAQVVGGATAIASNAPLLEQCGITRLPNVRAGLEELTQVRDAAAQAEYGITSADYLLADTGTLVLFSSREEARMISLLPPTHIAVAPREKLLSGLDELFALAPEPAKIASSMVLITGPSRTADIEQIIVRGVHGPGFVQVVLV